MNRRLEKQRYIENLIKSGALKIKVNDAPRYLTYTNPGIHYDDFDIYNRPDLIKMMLYAIKAEDIGENAHSFNDGDKMCSFMYWDTLLKDRTFFVGSVQYNFTRILYARDVPKWPLDVKFSFGGIGSTSLLQKSEFFLVNSQELVMSRLTKLIAVDRQSRRPVPHPDWYREKMTGKEVPLDDLIFTGFQRPQKGTFVRKIQIVLSDTDRNRHTNFASYVRFGLDTLHLALTLRARRKAAEAKENSLLPNIDSAPDLRTRHPKTNEAKSALNKLSVKSQICESGSCETSNASIDSHVAGSKSFEPLISTVDSALPRVTTVDSALPLVATIDSALPWVTIDIMRNGTKNLKICYRKECVEGDFVDVHIWQEKGEELTVRCSVDAVDGSPISQFILEYFGSLSNL
ncbi:unnamed protein product [Lymnaea stagnalis]|uniref:Uncharacterized protein n=1 Tax=Lymnaea stagnalis TaxID=6523 RepID=A0AAV2HIR3_LYMST